MTAFESLLKLNSSLAKIYDNSNCFIGTNLDITAKHPSVQENAEIRKKIHQLVVDLLLQSDLRNDIPKIIPVIVELKNRLRSLVLADMNSIASSLMGIDDCLGFIRDNRIPREFVQIGMQQEAREQTLLPKDALYASIVIDDDFEDLMSKNMCLEIISDKTPLILTARTYASLIPNERLAKEYWIFQNASGLLVVCYPKEPESEALEVLKERGFDIAQLSLIINDIECFKEMPYREYRQAVAEELPALFACKNIPKRFYFVGHGSATSKLTDPNKPESNAFTAGFTILQFRSILMRLQEVGMDYANLVSCCAGNRNLYEVFHGLPRSFTASICSLDGALPVSGYVAPGTESFLNIQLHKTSLFWSRISAVLGKKDAMLKPKHFKSALESIYGSNWESTPVISIKGVSYFAAVNVHKRSVVLPYGKLAKKKPIYEVNEECLLIYPQIVEVPIRLSRLHGNGLFPNIISMIPDHNQILFSKLETSENSPLKAIQEAFLKEGRSGSYEGSKTERLYVVKEFTGRFETFKNVVACFQPTKRYALFQKTGESGKWFLLTDKINEISLNEAFLLLHQGLRQMKTIQEAIDYSSGDKPEAKQSLDQVKSCYRTWLGLPVGQPGLIAALENIDRGDLGKIPFDLGQECYQLLLFYALYERKWEAVKFLSDHVTDYEKVDCFGKKMLHLLVERGDDPEQITYLLERGALPNAPDAQGFVALYYALQAGRTDLIDLLVKNAADSNAPMLGRSLVVISFQDDKVDLALTLARDYASKIFGTQILHYASHHVKWAEFFEIGLAQLRMAAKGDENVFCSNFLQTLLHVEEELVNSWSCLSEEKKALLMENFVYAFSTLRRNSKDIESLSTDFLKKKWCFKPDEFQKIVDSFTQ